MTLIKIFKWIVFNCSTIFKLFDIFSIPFPVIIFWYSYYFFICVLSHSLQTLFWFFAVTICVEVFCYCFHFACFHNSSYLLFLFYWITARYITSNFSCLFYSAFILLYVLIYLSTCCILPFSCVIHVCLVICSLYCSSIILVSIAFSCHFSCRRFVSFCFAFLYFSYLV